jgi:hypothetical protein
VVGFLVTTKVGFLSIETSRFVVLLQLKINNKKLIPTKTESVSIIVKSISDFWFVNSVTLKYRGFDFKSEQNLTFIDIMFTFNDMILMRFLNYAKKYC